MKKAEELFKEGYNCAQAVFCSHCENLGIDFETGLKLSSSFGGGMGRLREVCGTVSAMFMLLGLKKGCISIDDISLKKAHYSKIQELAKNFEDEFGSIVCRELLNLRSKKSEPEPEKRTDEYYKKRSCVDFVKFASNLIQKEL